MELKQTDIKLNQTFADKEAAIRFAGKLLVEQGYVQTAYIEKMIERDALTSTFIGNQVAIPHGTEGSNELINESGIVIIQVPEGVDFDGNEVKVVIGIAGADGEHLDVLSNIAIVCSEEENVEEIIHAQSAQAVIDLFEGSDL